MTDLFEQVYHHIEGRETEIQNWQTLDGIKTVEFHSFGPDRWIENVYERSRMTGIECLALILFEVDVSFSDPEPARRIVEGWAAELRKAVSAGEIQARDPVTLLALETLPDGWEWLLTMADGDKFIAARGMEWRFCEVASYLFKECEQAIQNRRFPPFVRTSPATESATPAPALTAPAPVAASDGPAPLPAVPNWKMRVQAEATAHVLRLRNCGASPTRHSILDSMAQWCRDNSVMTDGNIYPSANYLRTHVLGGKHWDVPN